jgi:beta-glucuronidase
MILQSRRTFVASLLLSGASCVGSTAATLNKESEQNDAPQDETGSFPLEEGWLFAYDLSASLTPTAQHISESDWKQVKVPHTWQAMEGNPEYVGVAWYRLEFTPFRNWTEKFVRIEFEAVTHTAHVFLNGKPAGQHNGKGYTAFTCDLSSLLDFGLNNVVMVRVDNRPSNAMLPRNKSYDWTDDGGLIRPVNLLITPKIFIDRVEIDAVPNIASKEANVSIRAQVRNTTEKSQAIELDASLHLEGTSFVAQNIHPTRQEVSRKATTIVESSTIIVTAPALWHFDSPHLYVATLNLKSAFGDHIYSETFGIRSFEVRGTAFYLNDEQVSLIGVERMAGSNPDFGMAETGEWIRRNHEDMKELNCVFTRVHWAQDKRVLDFCDRNGILMQEEVPAWGDETFDSTTDEEQHALEQNGLEQLREMIVCDRNHPCIVAWGLCNEVNGKNPRSRQFAHLLAAEARKLDPSRLLTYASNSLDSDPGADMAGDFDYISANEYYGSWAPGGSPQIRAYLDRIREAFPSKPVVISEYGWCECQPSIMPGDDNRLDIINAHTEIFREFPNVAGAIYFDYNDYRTLVGDKGTGAMKQRVHGVVDLYANRKPSFSALRIQASPIEHLSILNNSDGTYLLVISVRKQLPGYIMRGYKARWVVFGYDDLPMHGTVNKLPDLHPGESYTIQKSFSMNNARRLLVDILRPTGFSVMNVELSLAAR